MQIKNIRNVERWSNGDYRCIVDLHNDDGTLFESGAEYGALQDDPHSDVWARIEAGDYTGTITDIAPPTQAELDAQKATEVRRERDIKMSLFEWRISRYNREVRLNLTTTDDLANLDAYMQDLADITEQAGFPNDVTWPIEP